MIPAPVRHFVVSGVLVIGISREAGGWWSTAPILPNATHEPLSLAVIADRDSFTEEDLYGTIAHELAHAWCCPAGTPRGPRDLDEAREVYDYRLHLASQLGRLPEIFGPQMRDERHAARLARAWGFRGIAIDANYQEASARQRVLSDADTAGVRFSDV
jgi:hypothetical protein